MKGRFHLLALSASLLFIAFATLPPTWGYTRGVGFFCLGCGVYGLTDVILNVILFAPLGLVLGRRGMRPFLVLGVGLFLSGGIEALQLFIPGRAPTVRDVLTNGIGCGLGGVVGLYLPSWIASGRRATALLWAALAGFLAAIAITGLLLQFDVPEGSYFGQWAPERGDLVPWKGRLLAAWVDSLPVADGRSRQGETIRALLRDSVRVRITGVAGAPTLRTGSIFALATGDEVEVFLLASRGEDLLVRVHRRSLSWRMKSPAIRFPGALRGVAAGTPLTIAVDGHARRLCVTVNGTVQCAPRPAAGSTWTFARPYTWMPWWWNRGLDAFAVSLLLLPAALFVRSVSRAQALAAGAVLVVGFRLTAWSSGLALPGIWEWLGVAAALAAGYLINGRLRTRPSPTPPTPPGSRPHPAA